DDFWHRKYTEDERGRLVPLADRPPDANELPSVDPHSLHMRSPSYCPLVAALGLPIIAYGLIYSWALGLLGVVVLFAGLYGWGLEPQTEPEEPGGHVDPDQPHSGPGAAEAESDDQDKEP